MLAWPSSSSGCGTVWHDQTCGSVRFKTYFYRPQRSCGKVMFSQASVILFTLGCVSQHALGQTPPCPVHAGIHPKAETSWADTPGRHPHPPSDTPNPQADTPQGRQTSPGRHPPGQEGVCLGGWLPRGCLPGESAQGGYDSPPVDRMTDACENITFPQLLLRTAKIKRQQNKRIFQIVFHHFPPWMNLGKFGIVRWNQKVLTGPLHRCHMRNSIFIHRSK